jgi:hypothetical protein
MSDAQISGEYKIFITITTKRKEKNMRGNDNIEMIFPDLLSSLNELT